MSRLAAFALLAYLYLKLWDWAATNYYSHAPGTADAMTRLQATTPYNQSFWWLEVVLCGFVPAVILLNQPFRRRHGVLMTGLALIVFGVVVNRWNVTLSGLVVPPSWSPGVLGNAVAATYVPSWTEVAVSVGILGYATLAFTLGAKYLPLFTKKAEHHD
jgi:molybdopterin-containing oxidoreductase family membrane subunit